MTTPDELKRAAGNLAGLARDLERYDPWSGTRSKSDAADLRALLSERAELLAAVERMREQVELQKRRVDRRDEKIDRMRAAYNCLLADTDPTSKARAALTTGEANHKDKP